MWGWSAAVRKMNAEQAREDAAARRAAERAAQLQKASEDAGNGFYGGKPAYWDTNSDGSTNIFPGGMPRDHHSRMPHDHIVVNEDGGVEYMRIDDEEINKYRDGR